MIDEPILKLKTILFKTIANVVKYFFLTTILLLVVTFIQIDWRNELRIENPKKKNYYKSQIERGIQDNFDPLDIFIYQNEIQLFEDPLYEYDFMFEQMFDETENYFTDEDYFTDEEFMEYEEYQIQEDIWSE
ncbi:MAG: hypothetical protein NZ927_01290 [Candidatus Calescibacterium sp.]|nr:hypothetical protein [Candidatus Calescibacterium sp.]MCX7733656.1 hypothetical protein [bacterium]MDW8087159.1 hypothetical protein [Candidatus Calescibacterium sp.]